jgi:hypothetical protein
MKTEEARFSDKLIVRCPRRVSPLIDRAAKRKCMTASEYIRRSIIDRLEADGFDLAAEAA